MGKRIHWSFDGTQAYAVNTVSGVGTRHTLTAVQRNQLNDLPQAGYGYNIGALSDPYGAQANALIFNFPSPVEIDKFGIFEVSPEIFTVEVSNNSTNGLDGAWTVVGSAVANAASAYSEHAVSIQSASWLRLTTTVGTWWGSCSCLLLFGEYTTPRYEFWEDDNSAELVDNYPLLMPIAPNHEDYHGVLGFKLKNTHSEAHNYSLIIKAVNYAGDATITNYFTLSKDGGQNKAASIAISNVAAGSFSEVIEVYGDVPQANNPADGYHYFVIEVIETA